MKIKTRKQKLLEYNEQYPVRDPEAVSRLETYIHNLKNAEKWIRKAAKKALLIEERREYRTIHITLYEYPMKTDRPRTVNGHTFSPNAAENKQYMRKAVSSIKKIVSLINTPASIVIDAYMEMPAQVSPDEVILFETKRLSPIDKPDYDNIGKCYTDMLTDVLITDDDIFSHGEINKWYSLLPRVEITIRYQTKHDSNYVFKKLRNRKSIREALENGTVKLEKLGEE